MPLALQICSHLVTCLPSLRIGHCPFVSNIPPAQPPRQFPPPRVPRFSVRLCITPTKVIVFFFLSVSLFFLSVLPFRPPFLGVFLFLVSLYKLRLSPGKTPPPLPPPLKLHLGPLFRFRRFSFSPFLYTAIAFGVVPWTNVCIPDADRHRPLFPPLSRPPRYPFSSPSLFSRGCR